MKTTIATIILAFLYLLLLGLFMFAGCESNSNPNFWDAFAESIDRMAENERYEREYQLRWYSAYGPGGLRTAPRPQRPVIIMPHNYQQEQYYWRKNREALNNPYHPPLPR